MPLAHSSLLVYTSADSLESHSRTYEGTASVSSSGELLNIT